MNETQRLMDKTVDDDLAEEEAATQYLTFRIAGETYALGVLGVREILRYETVTRVPSTPRSIRGVINLRGGVVPVVDLAVKFGLPESRETKWTCIVIVEAEFDGEPTVMGIMTDSVNQVIELAPGDIEPPPPFGAGVRVDYLVGMGRSGRKFVLILDVDRVLSAEELQTAARLQEGDLSEEEEDASGEDSDGAETESRAEAVETASVVEKKPPAAAAGEAPKPPAATPAAESKASPAKEEGPDEA